MESRDSPFATKVATNRRHEKVPLYSHHGSIPVQLIVSIGVNYGHGLDFMMKRVHFASSLEWEGTGDMIDERLYNSTAQQTNDYAHLQLINLPDVCLEAILSNLSYDEISKYRIVSSLFNPRGGFFFTSLYTSRSIGSTMCFLGLQTVRSNL